MTTSVSGGHVCTMHAAPPSTAAVVAGGDIANAAPPATDANTTQAVADAQAAIASANTALAGAGGATGAIDGAALQQLVPTLQQLVGTLQGLVTTLQSQTGGGPAMPPPGEAPAPGAQPPAPGTDAGTATAGGDAAAGGCGCCGAMHAAQGARQGGASGAPEAPAADAQQGARERSAAASGGGAAPAPTGNDAQLTAQIQQYLQQKGSPLAGHAAHIVQVARREGLDPRLIVAIAGAESSFGKNLFRPYNAWGWMSSDQFDSWDEGLTRVSRGLKQNYIDQGLTSIARIQGKYAPNGASNDPTNLNSHWTRNVSQFYRELGGNPEDVRA